MESSVEEQGQKEPEVRRARKNDPCRTVGSCLMHKTLQFNNGERGQRGGTGCEAAAISEVALTEGAFVQSRTKRNCSVPNKKTPTEPQQVSIGNHAGKLISFVTYLPWRHQLRSRQMKAEV